MPNPRQSQLPQLPQPLTAVAVSCLILYRIYAEVDTLHYLDYMLWYGSMWVGISTAKFWCELEGSPIE